METDYKNLMNEAIAAKALSYSPYSNFKVGAALLGKSGKIYRGCNIENASYSPTNCAERTAVFKAISEGEKEFVAIAVTGGEMKAGDYCTPCGVCRQVLAEFCSSDFPVILGNSENDFKIFRLDELLPYGFFKERLGK